MKWAILVVFAVAFAGCLYWLGAFRRVGKQATVSIGGRAHYRVDIADTVLSTARGLSGRARLEADQGMLFIFPQAEPRYFWMNEMLFPLDVLWIREGKVVGLQEDIPHPAANGGAIARFQSPEPADMVLEIHAGEIAKQGIMVGDEVKLAKE